MTENLKLWESVSRVPPDQLKGFQRSGGFSGTAIKPMWSIKTMTEYYGPCGIGWGVLEPKFNVQQGHNETLVFCTVGVWHKSPECVVYGVGGDKILAQFKSGPRNDDEAFKKAYTDAITNALKMIGVGADIHMGLWDGNKYVDENANDPPANQSLPPIHNNTKSNSRDEMQALCKEINDIQSMAALERWKTNPDNITRQEALNDALFMTVKNAFQDKRRELMEKAAA
jgi:hypothetical protein